MAFDGRLPVLRRERMMENNSGSRSMKGTEFDSETLENKDLAPARVRVCFVVWKIWPPTLTVTMFESPPLACRNPFGTAKGGIFFSLFVYKYSQAALGKWNSWISEKDTGNWKVKFLVAGIFEEVCGDFIKY